jgi:hypothetical protein
VGEHKSSGGGDETKRSDELPREDGAVRFDIPTGLATVIGGVPSVLPADAARVMVDELPKLPSAPAIHLDAEHLDVDTLDRDEAVGLAGFFADFAGTVEPIILSLTGPITLDLDLQAHGASADEAAKAAVRAVEDIAQWVLDQARSVVPEAPLLLFLDEPGLRNSMHPTFPMSPPEIETVITEVVSTVGESAPVGVQVDARADFAMLLRTGVSALAAPVTARLETAAVELARFLEAGGVIAWGAVPTDEPLGLSTERLWRRLSALWCELTRVGADPMLLRERSIITPAGDLGAFGFSQAERVISLSKELASRVLHQTLGLRMSVGA